MVVLETIVKMGFWGRNGGFGDMIRAGAGEEAEGAEHKVQKPTVQSRGGDFRCWRVRPCLAPFFICPFCPPSVAMFITWVSIGLAIGEFSGWFM